MRIFNEDKTIELTEVDEAIGYLKEDVIETDIPEQKEVLEKWHYEVIAEYPNGGKDVKKVVDVEGKPYIPAHTEREEIWVYIPYTAEELVKMTAEREISELKQKLRDTDYQAIKFAEGELSEDEYAYMKAQRRAWRDRINELEGIIGGGTDG
jgi:hypothetical protein